MRKGYHTGKVRRCSQHACLSFCHAPVCMRMARHVLTQADSGTPMVARGYTATRYA